MPGSPLLMIAYFLLFVFAVAFLVRSIRLATLPIHLRWELSPVPHEKDKSRYGGSYLEDYEWWTKPREKSLVNELVYMFLEIVFLKSVWENNRRLWWFSFPFHFGMYLLIVVGAIFLLDGLLLVTVGPIERLDMLRKMVAVLAGVGYGLGGVGAVGLLVSRLCDSRLKAFTSLATLWNLVLLLGVFASGMVALLVASGSFPTRVATFVGALFTADTSHATDGLLTLHLVLIFVFLAYLPFSQMMHFVAKYFTYHKVRWDDEPMTVGGPMEKEVQKLLNQPVTWSAPHLNADGKKNWVDIATEEQKP